MTLNTYSHVFPVMQDEAAEKLDDLLTPINLSNEIKNWEMIKLLEYIWLETCQIEIWVAVR